MTTRCKTGKRKYQTELDAKIVVASFQKKAAKHRRNTQHEMPSRTYQCEFCSGWHLTSQEKRAS